MARFVIVGGVAGGASTAARLRRLDEKADIVLIERGEYVSYANCGLPYYAGGEIAERERLFVMTPEKFRGWLSVDVRVSTEAIAIDRNARTVRVRDLKDGTESSIAYDALVLSPGAEPIKPPIPGVDLEGIFSLRSVPDIDRIKRHLDTRRPERAIVVGGGFIGLEMAENLARRGVAVTVVEALPQVMNPLDPEMAAIVHQQLKSKGVGLALSNAVKSFERKGSRIAVRLEGGESLEADLVLLSIGVKPDTALARSAGLELAKNGAIKVDRYLRTSDPHIFALGDAVEFPHPVSGIPSTVPLAGPANKQARVVAANAVEPGSRVWNGALGTAIAKVFDIAAASTGLSEKACKAAGIPCRALVTHGSSHAGYYPGAVPISIKTVFSPDGRLLGAQVVGFDGVDKRIDLLAEALRRGSDVRELGEIEHAYAPPFSSAKDPVNIAGMAAENLLAHMTETVAWSEVAALVDSGACFLDVRSKDEFALGSIPGAVSIPIDELRGRLPEVPRNRRVIVFCGVGLRGYLAERVLRQSGWADVANLSGGYKTWELATEPQSNLSPSGFPDQGAAGNAQAMLKETFSEGSGSPESIKPKSDSTVIVDACGLQCPGPIMRLKKAIDESPSGGRVIVRATDPGFSKDVKAWCRLAGQELVSLSSEGAVLQAIVEKVSKPPIKAQGVSSLTDAASIVVFSDDLDKALASFVLASGAASAGKKTTMFFTFWGLSVIKRRKKPRVAKDLMGRLFSMMLPADSRKLSLSKMNFGGFGSSMMKGRMKRKNVDMLEDMIASVMEAGVRLVACQMSMDLMGVAKEELIGGVEIGGVATYMEAASEGNVNLFI
jgi:NADPH-dependent 2,4-dienoyl-CoA reductase/sulfur reductase-like enzyme/peroxiredoxin family protein/rhodanese-related sulfurtransferase/TusA-related sulfurtransferase